MKDSSIPCERVALDGLHTRENVDSGHTGLMPVVINKPGSSKTFGRCISSRHKVFSILP